MSLGMVGRQGREYHVFILHREMLFSALRLFFPKVGRPGEIKAGIDGGANARPKTSGHINITMKA